MLFWYAYDSRRGFEAYQQEIMKRSVLGASNQIDQLIEGLRTSLGLLVDEQQDALRDLARHPGDTERHTTISRQLTRYFPEYFAFTIANEQGSVFYDDLGERVGEYCLADIREFAKSNNSLKLVIHPGPGEYHFDVMLPWSYGNEKVGVFFASFKPKMLARLLHDSQLPRHSLMLLRRDLPDLIEVTSDGSRPEVKLKRGIRLSREELERVVYSEPVEHTRWVLADLPSETLFSDYYRTIRERTVIIFLGFLLISVFMLMVIRREENRRAAAERALRDSHKQLERANLSKSRFLAAASHDLRQPMHALGLFVDQLKGKVRSKDASEIVTQAQAAVEALGELFESVLDISRLDAGTLTPNLVAFPVRGILERMDAEFGEVARSKGLKFHVVPSHLIVNSDPVLLERIVLNLVSNAVHYTTTGGVLIGCRRRGRRARIEVWDTGCGIPDDQQQDIFSEFFQIERTRQGRGTGLGLGLTIVQRLGKLLEHPVELRSIPGEGSMFAVEVPIGSEAGPAKAATERQALADSLAGAFVLVVDDDLLVQEGMRGLFSSWGAHIVTAGSFEDAVTALAEHERLPDAIICDYWLPKGETGIQVIARLKAELSEDIPAVLISADASPELIQEARQNGCAYLQKPVKPAKLRALLSRILATA